MENNVQADLYYGEIDHLYHGMWANGTRFTVEEKVVTDKLLELLCYTARQDGYYICSWEELDGLEELEQHDEWHQQVWDYIADPFFWSLDDNGVKVSTNEIVWAIAA